MMHDPALIRLQREELALLEEREVREARRSLLAFGQRVSGHPPARHMVVMSRFIMAWLKGSVVWGAPIDRLMIFAPPRHAKPVAVTEFVWTARGRIPLRDVVVGDAVLTHKGRYRQVTAVHEQGVIPTLRVNTHHGRSVRMAPDHPVLTPRGWVQAQHLRVGEALACPSAYSPDLRRDPAARLAGYFVGDGCVVRGRKPCGAEHPSSMSANITAHDPIVADDIMRCCAEMGFTATAATKGGTLILVSGGVRQWLRDIGLAGLTSHTKHVPAFVMQGSVNAMREFAAAYFACDGTLCTRGGARRDLYFSFASVSRALLRDVRDILALCGVAGRIRHKVQARNTFVRGKHESWTLDITGADNTTRFAERIAFVGDRRRRLEEWDCVRTAFDRPFVEDHVVGVIPDTPAECRCITVNEDASFTAGGIAVHTSYYGSWFTPAFILGNFPRASVMHLTHTQKFADKMGRRIRNTVDGPRWPWPDIRVAADSSARDVWETTAGGVYNAFGLGGSPTGNPAEYLIWDDPLKGRKEADSVTIRDALWDTFLSDVWTRLQGAQKQLGMLTRWHEDDPSGRILPEGFDGRSGLYPERGTGRPWHVVSMPAVSEHDNDPAGRRIGEWLWPEEHGDGKEIEAQRLRGGRTWSALYQQRPAPEQGLYFDAANLRFYDRRTLRLDDLAIYGASDYAVTAEAGADDPDYTVHGVFGVDRNWNVYLLAMWRGREDSAVWVRELLTLVKAWSPLIWAEEDGQIIRGVGPFLGQQMRERRIMFARKQFTSSTSKEQRASALAGVIAMNRLWLPQGEEMGDATRKELLQFPAGRHDDIVDVCSLFCRLLAVLMEGRQPKDGDEPRPDSIAAMWARVEEAKRRE